MELLNTNSILRFLPQRLDKRSLLILDSLRFTIEMIDVSWNLLLELLNEQSKGIHEKSLPKLFINAWSIVDNIQRFINVYELLESDSNYRVLDPIRHVKSTRNTFAHMDERIDEILLKETEPFYGALTWEYRNNITSKVESFIAISGINYGSKHNFNISDFRKANRLIFNIKLETVDRKKKVVLNIEELIFSLKSIIEKLELTLQSKFNEKDLSLTDWKHIRDNIFIMKNSDSE